MARAERSTKAAQPRPLDPAQVSTKAAPRRPQRLRQPGSPVGAGPAEESISAVAAALVASGRVVPALAAGGPADAVLDSMEPLGVEVGRAAFVELVRPLYEKLC